MNPIINPNLFYWAGVAENINVITILLLIFSCIGMVIAVISWVVCWTENDDEYLPKILKVIKILCIMILILSLILIFAPSKETIYSMTVTELITPDNINVIIEKGEEGISFLVDQIEQIVNSAKQTE